MTDNAKEMGNMFQVSAAEMISKVQAEIAEAEIADRQAFYADDSIWDHEFCDSECDGQPHV